MTEVTMLNAMASKQFEAALRKLQSWGVRKLDLKDHIFGKSVLDLSLEEAERAAALAREHGQSIYCLSTTIFQDDVEQGEERFRPVHERRIEQASQVAAVLKPKLIRVLSAQSSKRTRFSDSAAYLETEHPWVFDLYRSAADRWHKEGYTMTIENDPSQNVFGTPSEIIRFFGILDRQGKTHFTFDVQNLWQMGVFPTMEVYEQLKPVIGYLHVKGGRKHPETGALQWRSSLQDASWPAAEMIRRAAADGVSPVICLNPSHGGKPEGVDDADMPKRDLDYMKFILDL